MACLTYHYKKNYNGLGYQNLIFYDFQAYQL